MVDRTDHGFVYIIIVFLYRYTASQGAGVAFVLVGSSRICLSDLVSGEKYLAASWRSGDRYPVSYHQQDYGGRDGIWRQLGNSGFRDISGLVGACRGTAYGIFYPGRIFCGSPHQEKAAGQIYASFLSVSDGRVSDCDVYRGRCTVRGYTIEMSYLMPVILLLIMSSIFGMFYFHDKAVLSGAAYEAAAVGGTKARKKAGVTAGEIEALFYERAGDKCILFDRIEVSVSVGDDEIRIQGTGTKRGMTVSVLKSMPVTEPEKRIRDKRRLTGAVNGTEDND